ncbi:MAG TPA: LysR substrate-binding domain-containing protein [Nitrospirota bacterium]|nr:LysR substrate-binding domain-containing protein [Nitrospirota bacterium]
MKHMFTLGASTIPGEFIIPRLLSAMLSHLPEIELKVEISDSLKVFEGVRKGQYEIGIIGTHFDSTDVEFSVIVKDDRLVLITPKNHSLATKGTIALGDLKGQNFISREKGSGTRAVYEKAFKDAGLALKDLNTVAEVGTTEGVIQAVEGGAGIAIVSELAAKEAIVLKKVQALNVPLLRMIRDFSIITRKGKPLSKNASEVLEVIKSVMK